MDMVQNSDGKEIPGEERSPVPPPPRPWKEPLASVSRVSLRGRSVHIRAHNVHLFPNDYLVHTLHLVVYTQQYISTYLGGLGHIKLPRPFPSRYNGCTIFYVTSDLFIHI